MIVPADQERLWQQYLASGHDAESRDITLRNKIAEANNRLVEVIVSSVCRGRKSKQDRDDCLQGGRIGLILAIERYDPSRGFKFATFATNYIVGAVLHYLRDNAGVIRCRKLVEAARQFATIRQLYVELFSVEPTLAQLAEFLDCSPLVLQEAESANMRQWPHSLDEIVFKKDFETDGLKYSDLIACDTGAQPSIHQLHLQAEVEEALEQMPNILSRIVIKLRYEASLSQKEVGAILHYSQMHISRIEREALQWLRNRLGVIQGNASTQHKRSVQAPRESTPEWQKLNEFINAANAKKKELGVIGARVTGITLNH